MTVNGFKKERKVVAMGDMNAKMGCVEIDEIGGK